MCTAPHNARSTGCRRLSSRSWAARRAPARRARSSCASHTSATSCFTRAARMAVRVSRLHYFYLYLLPITISCTSNCSTRTWRALCCLRLGASPRIVSRSPNIPRVESRRDESSPSTMSGRVAGAIDGFHLEGRQAGRQLAIGHYQSDPLLFAQTAISAVSHIASDQVIVRRVRYVHCM